MDFDASWCTVCDQLISPRRCTVPLAPHLPAGQGLPSRPMHPGKVQMRRGMVQPGRGACSQTPTDSQPRATQTPGPMQRTAAAAHRGPHSLYCSDECRAADSNPFHPSLAPVARLDHRTAEPTTSLVPNNRRYSPHALALAKQLGFPPLPDLNKIVYTNDSDEETAWQPDEYTGGIIMAGRRIAEVLPKPAKPRTSRWDPKPEVPKPVPGWTDGSNAWRASIYCNTRLHSDPAANDTPRPVFRTTRRANACIEERPTDPTLDLYEGFNLCLSKHVQSRLPPASSFNSPKPPIRRDWSLLPPHLEGKLLVPNVKLKFRSPSPASLPSPSDQSSLTPLRAKRRQPEPMKVSRVEDTLRYAPMKQPVRIVKKTERVVGGDGKEKWVEVELEELPQKLFLFPMAKQMALPPPE